MRMPMIVAADGRAGEGAGDEEKEGGGGAGEGGSGLRAWVGDWLGGVEWGVGVQGLGGGV